MLGAVTVALLLAVYPSGHSLEYSNAISAAGQYVALPHPADADTRRHAAYLARQHRIPLIADPNAKAVEIRSIR